MNVLDVRDLCIRIDSPESSHTIVEDISLAMRSGEVLALADTLEGDQALVAGSIQVPAGGSCDASANTLSCTLAAGTPPGSYDFVYQARVDADASGRIGNRVVPQGGGGGTPECTTCTTGHPVAEPVVTRRTIAFNPGG